MEGPSYEQFYDFKTNQLTDCSGILPRLAEYIWIERQRVKKVYNYRCDMQIEVSALEIYCENIRDLLWEPPADSPNQAKYLEMKAINNQKVKCVGQTWIRVNSPSEFLQ